MERRNGFSLRFYTIAVAMALGVAGMWYDAGIDWGSGPPPTDSWQVSQQPQLGHVRDRLDRLDRVADTQLTDATL